MKDGKVVSIDTPKETEVNAGHTCVKGRYAFGFYDHPDRLRSPLIKEMVNLKKHLGTKLMIILNLSLIKLKRKWT